MQQLVDEHVQATALSQVIQAAVLTRCYCAQQLQQQG